MSLNSIKNKISDVAFFIVFTMAVILSVGFCLFLGENATKDTMVSFKRYLEKENVAVSWSEKDDKLVIKRNQIELTQIKEFKIIKNLSYSPNEKSSLRFSFEGVDSVLNKLLFGSLLNDDFTEIKVIINNIENEELVTHKELSPLYEKYYPYTVALCDMDSYVYLNKREIKCPDTNHINLVIDTVNKSFEMKIAYYKEWGGIVSRYLTYSKVGIENKLADFKIASSEVKNKFGNDIQHLKIGKIYNSTIVVNGEPKKTIKALNTELLIITDDKKDYIEKNIGEISYYVAFKDNTIVDDFSYIINQLNPINTTKIKVREATPEIMPEKEKPLNSNSSLPIEKQAVIPDQTSKEDSIKDNTVDSSKSNEMKPLKESKSISVDEKQEAVKDVINEKIKKVNESSKTKIDNKPSAKPVEKEDTTKTP